MSIIKTIPIEKRINGMLVKASETAVVSEYEYTTNGEDCIIIKNTPHCNIKLDSKTTEHVVVKALTKITIIPDVGKIDEEYDEIVAEKGACIEFRCVERNWYILSSDGLKGS